jgi:hypothetical protein
MECPNCGHKNSENSVYCSSCSAELKDPLRATETNLKPAEVERRVLRWLLGIALSVTMMFLLLTVPSTLLIALYDLIAGHSLLIGLGYILAFEGGALSLIAALDLSQIPEKMVMARYSFKSGARPTLMPAVFYNTIFTPMRSAMLSTSGTDYDNSIVLVVASFLTFLVGLVLIG